MLNIWIADYLILVVKIQFIQNNLYVTILKILYLKALALYRNIGFV